MFMFNTSRRHTCVIDITEMLSYKDNRYDNQEFFFPFLLCFLELEVAWNCPELSLLGFTQPPATQRRVWLYSQADFDQTAELPDAYDLSTLQCSGNVDDCWKLWHSTFIQ